MTVQNHINVLLVVVKKKIEPAHEIMAFIT